MDWIFKAKTNEYVNGINAIYHKGGRTRTMILEEANDISVQCEEVDIGAKWTFDKLRGPGTGPPSALTRPSFKR